MGWFYSAELARRVSALLDAERFDLIFVHCSSVAQYVEHVRGIPKILDFGDMDSQKWLEYARYKPFPLSLGYRLEGVKMTSAKRSAWRGRFDLCTATTRAEWETLDGYRHRRADGLVPQRRRQRFFGPDDEPTTRTRSASSDAWTTTRTRNAWSTSARHTLPLAARQRPELKLLIVGADPSPAMRASPSCPASP